MEALNFAVSLVRPLVSATTGFLSMVGCTRTRTIDLAIPNTTGGAEAGSANQFDAVSEFDQRPAEGRDAGDPRRRTYSRSRRRPRRPHRADGGSH